MEENNNELFSYTKQVYKWLNSALDVGITEQQFWNMTIAELNRAIESKCRVMKREAQEKATYDYILAELIGRSVGRIYSQENTFPEISKVYPSLFDDEEAQEKKRQKELELSVMKLHQIANSLNKKFNKEVRTITDE